MEKPSKNSQQHKTQFLTIEDFEYLCFDFTRETLSYNEPIPDYSTKETALLESSLGSVQQTYGGELLYPMLEKQASILFYSLIKNHPFKNGNKRIAVMSLLVFLALNKKWLSISPPELYEIACTVSESKSGKKDEILDYLEEIFNRYIIDSPIVKDTTR